MNNELIISDKITINAPAAKVWDALVNPMQTKKYMFGCEALSDWKVGSPLIWRGIFEGVQLDAVKGHIVEIQPERSLVYTVIDPNNPAIPDIPENYLTVTYTLSLENGQTVLTVTQGDYNIVAEGETRYEHSIAGGGWSTILDAIKKLVEG